MIIKPLVIDTTIALSESSKFEARDTIQEEEKNPRNARNVALLSESTGIIESCHPIAIHNLYSCEKIAL